MRTKRDIRKHGQQCLLAGLLAACTLVPLLIMTANKDAMPPIDYACQTTAFATEIAVYLLSLGFAVAYGKPKALDYIRILRKHALAAGATAGLIALLIPDWNVIAIAVTDTAAMLGIAVIMSAIIGLYPKGRLQG